MEASLGFKRETVALDGAYSRIEAKMMQQRGSASLNLADSFLGDDGCESVARFVRENGGIISLDLRGNGITSAGLSALSSCLGGRCGLRTISLEWNNIGDELGPFAEALIKNHTVQVLDLRNNRIGAEGAGQLCKVIESNSTIQKIDLRWNEIGQKGASKLYSALSRPHSLKQLDLAGNKIPEELLSSLEKLLRGEFDSYQKTEISNTRSISPIKQKDYTYNDELFGKYENIMIYNARCEAKIKELEILLEQEGRKCSEIKYELGRDFENEKTRRILAEECYLRFKEETLKKEVENSKVVQELENKVNKLLSEKSVLGIEYESLQTQFDNFHRQTKDHIMSLEEKIDMQEKQYRLLEENERSSKESQKIQSEQERFTIIKDFQSKLGSADDKIKFLTQKNFELEVEIKSLNSQIIQIKASGQEELNDLELALREEESLKYDQMVENFESRVKNLEDSRDALNKKNQDLAYNLKFTEKKLNDQLLVKDSEINSSKSENSDLSKQLQKALNTIENLRCELSSARHEIEKVNSENEDLNKCIAERKVVFLDQIDQISQEHSREKSFLQDKIDDLSAALQKTEIELSRTKRDKDRVIKDHEYLSETLKLKVSNFIQDSVLAHMKKIQEEL